MKPGDMIEKHPADEDAPAKFVQIAVAEDGLIALDATGQVWALAAANWPKYAWIRVTAARQ